MLTSAGCGHASAKAGGEVPASTDPLLSVGAEELYRDGERMAQAGDPLRAEQYLNAAIQRGYPAQRALPLLLRVCIASSRLGVALQYATPYLQLHPEDYRLRYLVAAVQIGLGRASEARMELMRVVRDAPDFAEAHYLLGVLLRDHLNDSEGAAQAFTTHQRLKPDGLHGAEVSAWLREHGAQAATQPAAASAAALTGPTAPSDPALSADPSGLPSGPVPAEPAP